MIGILLISAHAADLRACSVPVFRYALERWEPDYYEIWIDQTGPLAGEAAAAVDFLAACANDEKNPANLFLRRPREENEEGEARQPEKKTGAAQAEMAVRFPRISRIPLTIWKGALTPQEAKKIVDSPARREIARRLIAGEAAVWILLESGQAEKDRVAAEVLENELAELKATIELPPDPMAWDWEADKPLEGATSLTIGFSMLRVRRDDPKESFLVASLLRTEPDLLELREPMAFPVFARGRVLFTLAGKGINADNICEACSFLAAPCSCQVKVLNPGVDLLMRDDWNQVFEGTLFAETSLPPLVGLATVAEAAGTSQGLATTSTLMQARAEGDTPEPESRKSPIGNLLIVLGAIVLIISSLSLRAARKRRM